MDRKKSYIISGIIILVILIASAGIFLPRYFENRSVNNGYDSGYNNGYNNGYIHGYNNGYNGGYNDSSLMQSTRRRTKMNTAHTIYNDNWYTDELGWFERGGRTLINGLESFYNKTGVQPYVYLYAEDGSHIYQKPDLMEKVANELYNEIFGADEGHLLFVYFACPGDSPDVMDGDYIFICGNQTTVVMDEEAKQILDSRFKYHYDDTTLSVDELFAKTFKDAGKSIMAGPIHMRYVVIIVVAIIAVVVVVALLFKWWKAKKAQKNKEAEDLEKILNTPLETFGNKEVDDLKDKYEE